MAKSQYEYVKFFEQPDALLPDCWLVVRVDGHRFHAFSAAHNWHKPQDDRQIALMNDTATRVMHAYTDITLAIGMSDEYSFVLPPHSQLYGRRREKLTSCICSLFAATYTLLYSTHFPTPPSYPPHFDGRTVAYPTTASLHDYLRWRQVDCHINHLYNTCYVRMRARGSGGMTGAAVEAELGAMDSAAKNEMLWREFGINYNEEKAVYRKGSVIVWERYSKDTAAAAGAAEHKEERADNSDATGGKEAAEADSEASATDATVRSSPARQRRRCVVLHEDLITAPFFELHPGVIPPINNTEWKKQLMKDEKKAKKEQYKAATGVQRQKQQQQQQQQRKQQPSSTPSAPASTTSVDTHT